MRFAYSIALFDSVYQQMNSKVPLQGTELEAFLAKEKAAKDKEAAHQASIARNQRILEADEDESDDDSDSDSEEEDEVERALNESHMDTDESPGPVTSRRKRKTPKDEDDADWGLDMDETKQLLSFDIYLKGNVSKATSFFKSAGSQTHRFRMFPYVEKKRRVDEYGETIDVGMWLRKGKVLENEADDEAGRDARRNQVEGETEVKISIEMYNQLTDEPDVQGPS